MAVAPYITVKQLAERLQICIDNAYALVNTGQIRSVRIGRSIRIPEHRFAEWEAKQFQPDSPRAG